MPAPRRTEWRFASGLPRASYTDIVANSHNGFFVGNGNDFLAFLKAVAATNEKSPHPSPIEQFLGTHPAALKVMRGLEGRREELRESRLLRQQRIRVRRCRGRQARRPLSDHSGCRRREARLRHRSKAEAGLHVHRPQGSAVYALSVAHRR